MQLIWCEYHLYIKTKDIVKKNFWSISTMIMNVKHIKNDSANQIQQQGKNKMCHDQMRFILAVQISLTGKYQWMKFIIFANKTLYIMSVNVEKHLKSYTTILLKKIKTSQQKKNRGELFPLKTSMKNLQPVSCLMVFTLSP